MFVQLDADECNVPVLENKITDRLPGRPDESEVFLFEVKNQRALGVFAG